MALKKKAGNAEFPKVVVLDSDGKPVDGNVAEIWSHVGDVVSMVFECILRLVSKVRMNVRSWWDNLVNPTTTEKTPEESKIDTLKHARDNLVLGILLLLAVPFMGKDMPRLIGMTGFVEALALICSFVYTRVAINEGHENDFVKEHAFSGMTRMLGSFFVLVVGLTAISVWLLSSNSEYVNELVKYFPQLRSFGEWQIGLVQELLVFIASKL